ncbi:aminopeptidase Y [Streptosporangium becharense]|uniref:Aminopeptidase Y n=1 Tax=Streptosporangium becharense TaxID=1816182 RepID=A0A7W9IHH7_9ACTN|nr:M28 family metallopeptidase [Streptosporangium becharense]MBB2912356.1 aminopeptidase Y [Streptosporangium becharense]MBB5820815.1 aminopeptidase Y [Streptosporangium becharense]
MRARASRGLLTAITAVSAVAPALCAGPADAAPAPEPAALPVVPPAVMPAAVSPPGPGGQPGAGPARRPNPGTFQGSARTPAVKRHLTHLQRIADENGGTRASGTPGFDASAAYVADRLRAAGYRVTMQEFEFPFFRDVEPPVLKRTAPAAKTYELGEDFRTMTYSGSGNVTAPVQGVDLVLPPSPAPSSTSGCEASDFAGFTRGNIALLQRGTCTFQVKVELAQAAGAAGVIIFNEGQRGTDDRTGLLGGTLGAPTVNIPVVGTTFAAGEELAAAGTTVTLTAKTEGDPRRKTHNVIAESRWGDPDRVVMLGAHLDSVAEGPGINDNGSGTAAVLETALAANVLPTRNRLRFAFWGAEELGLLGSRHYVSALSAAEKEKIKLYLNFDMVASPNHIFGIYDGDDSDAVGAPAGPPGSDKIEELFESYFRTMGLSYQGTDFTGRSDYGPFIEAGIPSGGLFTGAEGIKSAEEAAKFGGKAGEAYDKCYHRRCDTIANIGDKPLGVNTGAIMMAAFVYAYASDLPGAGAPGRTAVQPTKGGGGLEHQHGDTPASR